MNEVRIGTVSTANAAIIASTANRQFNTSDGIVPTLMHCVRESVREENKSALDKLPGMPILFGAEDDRLTDAERNGAIAPQTVYLKVGYDITRHRSLFHSSLNSLYCIDLCCDSAQVMLLCNMIQFNLCKGSRGVATRFNANGLPVVRFVCGKELEIERHTWHYDRDSGKAATRVQIPLDLAWVRATAFAVSAWTNIARRAVGYDS